MTPDQVDQLRDALESKVVVYTGDVSEGEQVTEVVSTSKAILLGGDTLNLGTADSTAFYALTPLVFV